MNSINSVARLSWASGVCRCSAFISSAPVTNCFPGDRPVPTTVGVDAPYRAGIHGAYAPGREWRLARLEKKSRLGTAVGAWSERLPAGSARTVRTTSSQPDPSSVGRNTFAPSQRGRPKPTYQELPATTRSLTTSLAETVTANEMAGPDKSKSGKKQKSAPGIPQPSARYARPPIRGSRGFTQLSWKTRGRKAKANTGTHIHAQCRRAFTR